MKEEKVKKYNNIESSKDEINLKDLQIKLEKIRSYVRKAEVRVSNNATILQKLRDKQMEVESKRLQVSIVKNRKLNNSI